MCIVNFVYISLAPTHTQTHTRTHARTHARARARTHARTHTHTHKHTQTLPLRRVKFTCSINKLHGACAWIDYEYQNTITSTENLEGEIDGNTQMAVS